MRIRILSLIIVAIIAGLSWSLGPYHHIIIRHFIAPPLFAFAVAFWARSSPWQFFLLTSILVFAELIRLAIYCIVANGWHYLTSDGATQSASLFSFLVQWFIAILAWAVFIFLIRLYERRAA